MATGDQTDIIMRLQRWLPQGWFPTTPGTRVYAIVAGLASVLASIYALIAYAALQTRIATATDGFLDIISRDYLGGNLPRLPGETDAAFAARIRANLFLAANTRTAIKTYLEAVTGNPVRMIEPWQPNDNARYGNSFYGYNRAGRPGQYSNGARRYSGLIVCSLPVAGGGGRPRRGYGGSFYAHDPSLVSPAGANYSEPLANAGQLTVFNAINRLKVFGTDIYVKFVSPNQLP